MHDMTYVIGEPGDYIVRCDCGWIRDGFATPDAARAAYWEHAREVTVHPCKTCGNPVPPHYVRSDLSVYPAFCSTGCARRAAESAVYTVTDIYTGQTTTRILHRIEADELDAAGYEVLAIAD